MWSSGGETEDFPKALHDGGAREVVHATIRVSSTGAPALVHGRTASAEPRIVLCLAPIGEAPKAVDPLSAGGSTAFETDSNVFLREPVNRILAEVLADPRADRAYEVDR